MRNPKYKLLWREAVSFSLLLTLAILMETLPEEPKRTFELYIEKGWMVTALAWLFVLVGFLMFRSRFHTFMVIMWGVLGWMIGANFSQQVAIGMAAGFLVLRFLIRAVMVRGRKEEAKLHRGQLDDEEEDEDDDDEVAQGNAAAFLKQYDRRGYAIAFDREGLIKFHWLIESLSPDTSVLISKEVLYSVDSYVTQYLEDLQNNPKQANRLFLVHADARFLQQENLDPHNERDRTVAAYLQYQDRAGRQVIMVCEDSATRVVAKSVGMRCETLAG